MIRATKAIAQVCRSIRLASVRPAAARRCMVEGLEPRKLFATVVLSNGTGDGTLSIGVDAYGSYGSSTPAGDAEYDPVGATEAKGTTFESGVFFSPLGEFLTEDTFGGNLPSVAFLSTSANEAVSQFTSSGYSIVLTQTVQPPDLEDRTNFVQTYQITNNTGSTQTFEMIRHVDGDLYFVGGLGDDYAGVSADGRFLFEFDTFAADPELSTGYFGITASGDGTPAGYTVQSYSYFDNIDAVDGIPAADLNKIFGDDNENRITDFGYDVTVSLADTFTVANGQTVTYTTTTVFGQGSPATLLNPGSIEINEESIEVDEDAGTVTFTVDRVGGVTGDVGATYSLVPGTATANVDYTAATGTVTFLNDDATSQTIVIQIIDDSLVEGNENFVIELSDVTGGATIGDQSDTPVTIIDNDGSVEFILPSVTVREDAGVVTLLVRRSGGIDVQHTVDFTTANGTAVAGSDYTATTGTLTFAAGETDKSFTVPILTDLDLAELTETFTVSLVNPGTSLEVGGNGSSVVSIRNIDTVAPTVIATNFIVGGGKIRSVQLIYSETINFNPATQSYQLIDHNTYGPAAGGTSKNVRVKSVSYDGNTQTVTVTPRKSLSQNRFYQIIASNDASITDRSGNILDGDANGVAGGQFSQYFARGSRLRYTEFDGDRIDLQLRGGGGAITFRADSTFSTRDIALSDAAGATLTGNVIKRKTFGDERTILSTLTGTESTTLDLATGEFIFAA